MVWYRFPVDETCRTRAFLFQMKPKKQRSAELLAIVLDGCVDHLERLTADENFPQKMYFNTFAFRHKVLSIKLYSGG